MANHRSGAGRRRFRQPALKGAGNRNVRSMCELAVDRETPSGQRLVGNGVGHSVGVTTSRLVSTLGDDERVDRRHIGQHVDIDGR